MVFLGGWAFSYERGTPACTIFARKSSPAETTEPGYGLYGTKRPKLVEVGRIVVKVDGSSTKTSTKTCMGTAPPWESSGKLWYGENVH